MCLFDMSYFSGVQVTVPVSDLVDSPPKPGKQAASVSKKNFPLKYSSAGDLVLSIESTLPSGAGSYTAAAGGPESFAEGKEEQPTEQPEGKQVDGPPAQSASASVPPSAINDIERQYTKSAIVTGASLSRLFEKAGHPVERHALEEALQSTGAGKTKRLSIATVIDVYKETQRLAPTPGSSPARDGSAPFGNKADSHARGGGGDLREGDAVEGNFRGRGKWYPGRIHRVNPDGTFHVKYADGDEEMFAPSHRVRAAGGAQGGTPGPGHGGSGGGGGGDLREGDAVEGKASETEKPARSDGGFPVQSQGPDMDDESWRNEGWVHRMGATLLSKVEDAFFRYSSSISREVEARRNRKSLPPLPHRGRVLAVRQLPSALKDTGRRITSSRLLGWMDMFGFDANDVLSLSEFARAFDFLFVSGEDVGKAADAVEHVWRPVPKAADTQHTSTIAQKMHADVAALSVSAAAARVLVSYGPASSHGESDEVVSDMLRAVAAGRSAAESRALETAFDFFKRADAPGAAPLSIPVAEIPSLLSSLKRRKGLARDVAAQADLVDRLEARGANTAHVNFWEWLTVFGYVIEEAGAVVSRTVEAAVQQLRFSASTQEMRTCMQTVLQYLNDALDHPHSSSWWKINTNDAVFNSDVARLGGGYLLVKACGFTEQYVEGSTWLLLRAGFDISGIPKPSLSLQDRRLLAARRRELEGAIAELDDGMPTPAGVLRSMVHCGGLDAALAGGSLLLQYVDNVLSSPGKDKFWTISGENVVLQRRLLRLGRGVAVAGLKSAGFAPCISQEAGSTTSPVFTLIGNPQDEAASGFKFPVIPEDVLQRLWHRRGVFKQELACLARLQRDGQDSMGPGFGSYSPEALSMDPGVVKTQGRPNFAADAGKAAPMDHVKQSGTSLPKRGAQASERKGHRQDLAASVAVGLAAAADAMSGSALNGRPATQHALPAERLDVTALPVQRDQVRAAREVFRSLCPPGSTSVSATDLRKHAALQGDAAGEKSAGELIAALDADQDGKVSLFDFVKSTSVALLVPGVGSGELDSAAAADFLTLLPGPGVLSAVGTLRLMASPAECVQVLLGAQSVVQQLIAAASSSADWSFHARVPGPDERAPPRWTSQATPLPAALLRTPWASLIMRTIGLVPIIPPGTGRVATWQAAARSQGGHILLRFMGDASERWKQIPSALLSKLQQLLVSLTQHRVILQLGSLPHVAAVTAAVRTLVMSAEDLDSLNHDSKPVLPDGSIPSVEGSSQDTMLSMYTALKTLSAYLSNVTRRPDEPLYRRVNPRNTAFQQRMKDIPMPGAWVCPPVPGSVRVLGEHLLVAAGWVDCADGTLVLPASVDLGTLSARCLELQATLRALKPLVKQARSKSDSQASQGGELTHSRDPVRSNRGGQHSGFHSAPPTSSDVALREEARSTAAEEQVSDLSAAQHKRGALVARAQSDRIRSLEAEVASLQEQLHARVPDKAAAVLRSMRASDRAQVLKLLKAAGMGRMPETGSLSLAGVDSLLQQAPKAGLYDGATPASAATLSTSSLHRDASKGTTALSTTLDTRRRAGSSTRATRPSASSRSAAPLSQPTFLTTHAPAGDVQVALQSLALSVLRRSAKLSKSRAKRRGRGRKAALQPRRIRGTPSAEPPTTDLVSAKSSSGSAAALLEVAGDGETLPVQLGERVRIGAEGQEEEAFVTGVDQQSQIVQLDRPLTFDHPMGTPLVLIDTPAAQKQDFLRKDLKAMVAAVLDHAIGVAVQRGEASRTSASLTNSFQTRLIPKVGLFPTELTRTTAGAGAKLFLGRGGPSWAMEDASWGTAACSWDSPVEMAAGAFFDALDFHATDSLSLQRLASALSGGHVPHVAGVPPFFQPASILHLLRSSVGSGGSSLACEAGSLETSALNQTPDQVSSALIASWRSMNTQHSCLSHSEHALRAWAVEHSSLDRKQFVGLYSRVRSLASGPQAAQLTPLPCSGESVRTLQLVLHDETRLARELCGSALDDTMLGQLASGFAAVCANVNYGVVVDSSWKRVGPQMSLPLKAVAAVIWECDGVQVPATALEQGAAAAIGEIAYAPSALLDTDDGLHASPVQGITFSAFVQLRQELIDVSTAAVEAHCAEPWQAGFAQGSDAAWPKYAPRRAALRERLRKAFNACARQGVRAMTSSELISMLSRSHEGASMLDSCAIPGCSESLRTSLERFSSRLTWGALACFIRYPAFSQSGIQCSPPRLSAPSLPGTPTHTAVCSEAGLKACMTEQGELVISRLDTPEHVHVNLQGFLPTPVQPGAVCIVWSYPQAATGTPQLWVIVSGVNCIQVDPGSGSVAGITKLNGVPDHAARNSSQIMHRGQPLASMCVWFEHFLLISWVPTTGALRVHCLLSGNLVGIAECQPKARAGPLCILTHLECLVVGHIGRLDFWDLRPALKAAAEARTALQRGDAPSAPATVTCLASAESPQWRAVAHPPEVVALSFSEPACCLAVLDAAGELHAWDVYAPLHRMASPASALHLTRHDSLRDTSENSCDWLGTDAPLSEPEAVEMQQAVPLRYCGVVNTGGGVAGLSGILIPSSGGSSGFQPQDWMAKLQRITAKAQSAPRGSLHEGAIYIFSDGTVRAIDAPHLCPELITLHCPAALFQSQVSTRHVSESGARLQASFAALLKVHRQRALIQRVVLVAASSVPLSMLADSLLMPTVGTDSGGWRGEVPTCLASESDLKAALLRVHHACSAPAPVPEEDVGERQLHAIAEQKTYGEASAGPYVEVVYTPGDGPEECMRPAQRNRDAVGGKCIGYLKQVVDSTAYVSLAHVAEELHIAVDEVSVLGMHSVSRAARAGDWVLLDAPDELLDQYPVLRHCDPRTAGLPAPRCVSKTSALLGVTLDDGQCLLLALNRMAISRSVVSLTQQLSESEVGAAVSAAATLSAQDLLLCFHESSSLSWNLSQIRGLASLAALECSSLASRWRHAPDGELSVASALQLQRDFSAALQLTVACASAPRWVQEGLLPHAMYTALQLAFKPGTNVARLLATLTSVVAAFPPLQAACAPFVGLQSTPSKSGAPLRDSLTHTSMESCRLSFCHDEVESAEDAEVYAALWGRLRSAILRCASAPQQSPAADISAPVHVRWQVLKQAAAECVLPPALSGGHGPSTCWDAVAALQKYLPSAVPHPQWQHLASSSTNAMQTSRALALGPFSAAVPAGGDWPAASASQLLPLEHQLEVVSALQPVELAEAALLRTHSLTLTAAEWLAAPGGLAAVLVGQECVQEPPDGAQGQPSVGPEHSTPPHSLLLQHFAIPAADLLNSLACPQHQRLQVVPAGDNLSRLLTCLSIAEVVLCDAPADAAASRAARSGSVRSGNEGLSLRQFERLWLHLADDARAEGRDFFLSVKSLDVLACLVLLHSASAGAPPLSAHQEEKLDEEELADLACQVFASLLRRLACDPFVEGQPAAFRLSCSAAVLSAAGALATGKAFGLDQQVQAAEDGDDLQQERCVTPATLASGAALLRFLVGRDGMGGMAAPNVSYLLQHPGVFTVGAHPHEVQDRAAGTPPVASFYFGFLPARGRTVDDGPPPDRAGTEAIAGLLAAAQSVHSGEAPAQALAAWFPGAAPSSSSVLRSSVWLAEAADVAEGLRQLMLGVHLNQIHAQRTGAAKARQTIRAALSAWLPSTTAKSRGSPSLSLDKLALVEDFALVDSLVPLLASPDQHVRAAVLLTAKDIAQASERAHHTEKSGASLPVGAVPPSAVRRLLRPFLTPQAVHGVTQRVKLSMPGTAARHLGDDGAAVQAAIACLCGIARSGMADAATWLACDVPSTLELAAHKGDPSWRRDAEQLHEDLQSGTLIPALAGLLPRSTGPSTVSEGGEVQSLEEVVALLRTVLVSFSDAGLGEVLGLTVAEATGGHIAFAPASEAPLIGLNMAEDDRSTFAECLLPAVAGMPAVMHLLSVALAEEAASVANHFAVHESALRSVKLAAVSLACTPSTAPPTVDTALQTVPPIPQHRSLLHRAIAMLWELADVSWRGLLNMAPETHVAGVAASFVTRWLDWVRWSQAQGPMHSAFVLCCSAGAEHTLQPCTQRLQWLMHMASQRLPWVLSIACPARLVQVHMVDVVSATLQGIVSLRNGRLPELAQAGAPQHIDMAFTVQELRGVLAAQGLQDPLANVWAVTEWGVEWTLLGACMGWQGSSPAPDAVGGASESPMRATACHMLHARLQQDHDLVVLSHKHGAEHIHLPGLLPRAIVGRAQALQAFLGLLETSPSSPVTSSMVDCFKASGVLQCIVGVLLSSQVPVSVDFHLVPADFAPYNGSYPLRYEGVATLVQLCKSLFAQYSSAKACVEALPSPLQDDFQPRASDALHKHLTQLICQEHLARTERHRLFEFKDPQLVTTVEHVMQCLVSLGSSHILRMLSEAEVSIPDHWLHLDASGPGNAVLVTGAHSLDLRPWRNRCSLVGASEPSSLQADDGGAARPPRPPRVPEVVLPGPGHAPPSRRLAGVALPVPTQPVRGDGATPPPHTGITPSVLPPSHRSDVGSRPRLVPSADSAPRVLGGTGPRETARILVWLRPSHAGPDAASHVRAVLEAVLAGMSTETGDRKPHRVHEARAHTAPQDGVPFSATGMSEPGPGTVVECSASLATAAALWHGLQPERLASFGMVRCGFLGVGIEGFRPIDLSAVALEEDLEQGSASGHEGEAGRAHPRRPTDSSATSTHPATLETSVAKAGDVLDHLAEGIVPVKAAFDAQLRSVLQQHDALQASLRDLRTAAMIKRGRRSEAADAESNMAKLEAQLSVLSPAVGGERQPRLPAAHAAEALQTLGLDPSNVFGTTGEHSPRTFFGFLVDVETCLLAAHDAINRSVGGAQWSRVKSMPSWAAGWTLWKTGRQQGSVERSTEQDGKEQGLEDGDPPDSAASESGGHFRAAGVLHISRQDLARRLSPSQRKLALAAWSEFSSRGAGPAAGTIGLSVASASAALDAIGMGTLRTSASRELWRFLSRPLHGLLSEEEWLLAVAAVLAYQGPAVPVPQAGSASTLSAQEREQRRQAATKAVMRRQAEAAAHSQQQRPAASGQPEAAAPELAGTQTDSPSGHVGRPQDGASARSASTTKSGRQSPVGSQTELPHPAPAKDDQPSPGSAERQVPEGSAAAQRSGETQTGDAADGAGTGRTTESTVSRDSADSFGFGDVPAPVAGAGAGAGAPALTLGLTPAVVGPAAGDTQVASDSAPAEAGDTSEPAPEQADGEPADTPTLALPTPSDGAVEDGEASDETRKSATAPPNSAGGPPAADSASGSGGSGAAATAVQGSAEADGGYAEDGFEESIDLDAS